MQPPMTRHGYTRAILQHSCITDVDGHYSFDSVHNGTYTVIPSTTKPWGGVTASDVLLYQKRIANIQNSFPEGDWLFNNQPVNINDANVICDFDGICYGDANASYIPPLND